MPKIGFQNAFASVLVRPAHFCMSSASFGKYRLFRLFRLAGFPRIYRRNLCDVSVRGLSEMEGDLSSEAYAQILDTRREGIFYEMIEGQTKKDASGEM